MAGRPLELTAEIARKLSEAFRTGAGVRAACGMAGITTTTYGNWMKAGKEGDPRFTAFVTLMERSRAEPDIKAYSCIMDKITNEPDKLDDRWLAAKTLIQLRMQADLMRAKAKDKAVNVQVNVASGDIAEAIARIEAEDI